MLHSYSFLRSDNPISIQRCSTTKHPHADEKDHNDDNDNNNGHDTTNNDNDDDKNCCMRIPSEHHSSSSLSSPFRFLPCRHSRHCRGRHSKFVFTILLLVILRDDKKRTALVVRPHEQYHPATRPHTNTNSNTTILPDWKEGFLDIHHIRVGSSVSTFVIFPDGTTFLIDAGDIHIPNQYKMWQTSTKYKNLQLKQPYPNESKSCAAWILQYIHHFYPKQRQPRRRQEREQPSNTIHTTTVHNNSDTLFSSGLDYVLLTHFHTDHIGEPTPSSRSSSSKKPSYKLSGITEIGNQIPIHTFLDRGYPLYNEPSQLQTAEPYKYIMNNYIQFIHNLESKQPPPQNPTTTTTKTIVQRFQVGSSSQITYQHLPPNLQSSYHHHNKNHHVHFVVRNIKANLEVVVPTSKKDSAATSRHKFIQGIQLENESTWNENELSCALVIEYGDFRYYHGGDQESHTTIATKRKTKGDPNNNRSQTSSSLFDTITPTAQAAGSVDVATLNHHGHGINDAFFQIMNPQMVVLQGWCNDQPPDSTLQLLHQKQQQHPDQKPHAFATDMFPERIEEFWKHASPPSPLSPQSSSSFKTTQKRQPPLFTSTAGHVVVRVHPPPPHQQQSDNVKKSDSPHQQQDVQEQNFDVFVLDEFYRIVSKHGPYKAGVH